MSVIGRLLNMVVGRRAVLSWCFICNLFDRMGFTNMAACSILCCGSLVT